MLMVWHESVLGRLAERRLKKGGSPEHVAVVFGSDAVPSAVRDFYVWCEEFGVETATACVPDADEEHRRRIEEALEGLEPPVRTTDGEERIEDSERALSYVGGRAELVGIFRSLTEDVEDGDTDPDEIDFAEIENRLAVSVEPDLVIDTRGKSLSDVLVWQTAYSELCETEEFDRPSFVRCLDDYTKRERRFGR